MIPVLLARTAHPSVSVEPLTRIPVQTDIIGWCHEMAIGTAVLLALLGVVYLLYGFNWYRQLITLNAGIMGAYAGALIGQRAGDYVLAGGMVGAIVAAAVAWPLMKWAVAVMGGICGAAVGASIWMIAGPDPTYAWAGAMTGLVGFGLLSFIIFRGSIITYTSLQGSLMLIVGMLGLLLKYPTWAPTISVNVSSQPFMLPIAVLIPAVLGLIYQQTHSTAAAAAGGGGGGGGGDAKKK